MTKTAATTAPDIAVSRISDFLHRHNTKLWDRGLHACVIDSCEENVADSGLREEDDRDAFWAEVLGQLRSELDSFGVVADANGKCKIIP